MPERARAIGFMEITKAKQMHLAVHGLWSIGLVRPLIQTTIASKESNHASSILVSVAAMLAVVRTTPSMIVRFTRLATSITTVRSIRS
jgi:hypothetical protein